jgi:hypothetical protein
VDYSALESGEILEGHRTFKVIEVIKDTGSRLLGSFALIKVDMGVGPRGEPGRVSVVPGL